MMPGQTHRGIATEDADESGGPSELPRRPGMIEMASSMSTQSRHGPPLLAGASSRGGASSDGNLSNVMDWVDQKRFGKVPARTLWALH